jgi:hypothetical protein
MNALEERQVNQAAFRRLAGSINQTYPHGRFVAIADGKIIADAASFGELESALRTLGQDSVDVLVVQAGVDYPESAIIFEDDEEDIPATGEMVDRMMADVYADDPTLESYQHYQRKSTR